MERLENDKYYRYCTYAFIPFQFASVVFGAYLFTADNLSWLGYDGPLGWIGKVGVALSVGVLGGVGINTAHEMGHKKDSLERWLSKVTLAQTFYGHFFIEHNRGHHVRVATPEDPASARMGESLWAFLPRSVWGSLRSSWALEAQRMRRLDKSAFNIGNDVVNAWLMSVVLWGVLLAVFGWTLIPFVVVQAVVGFGLLETVNYLEHYAAAAENRTRSLRAVQARAQLELGPHRDERLPVPPAAAQRPPRQPHPPLPDAAQLRRRAEPAQRILQHDPADVDTAVVAQGDGSAGGGALRRRYHQGTSAPAEAREADRQVWSGAPARRRDSTVSAYRCPVCDYVYDEAKGAPREGFPAGTGWDHIPDDWCCPDCGVREKVDFESMEVTR
jgi:alkane 1-monooxygenase